MCCPHEVPPPKSQINLSKVVLVPALLLRDATSSPFLSSFGPFTIMASPVTPLKEQAYWLINAFFRRKQASRPERAGLDIPNTTYLQSGVAGTDAEYKRLDDIHNAIKGIQNGALSFLTLEAPKLILDMGTGSAAWAIQAAQTFPKATVVAVDIIARPNRKLPRNLDYMEVNLCEPFPGQLKAASFNVIHTRLVLIHLPNYRVTLERTIELLKPGGWLLVTDVVMTPRGIRNTLPSRLHRFFQGRADLIASTGGSPNIGQELSNVLGSFPQLVEVNVKKISVPISRYRDETLEPALRELSAALRRSLLFGIGSSPQFGISREELTQDLDDPANDIYYDIYFTWSRKVD